jgi:hypothetical protein
MSKSIKATATKLSEQDQWPIDFGRQTDEIKSLMDAGMKVYWLPMMFEYALSYGWNKLLTLEAHHYFPTDELFERYKNIAYTCIPGWVQPLSAEDLAAYYAANHITVTLEEISNPDLTGYELFEDRW